MYMYMYASETKAPGLVDAEKYGKQSQEHKDLRGRDESVEQEV